MVVLFNSFDHGHQAGQLLHCRYCLLFDIYIVGFLAEGDKKIAPSTVEAIRKKYETLGSSRAPPFKSYF